MMIQSYLNPKKLSLEVRQLRILTEDSNYVLYDTQIPFI